MDLFGTSAWKAARSISEESMLKTFQNEDNAARSGGYFHLQGNAWSHHRVTGTGSDIAQYLFFLHWVLFTYTLLIVVKNTLAETT